ncbi:MotA/TolQ/ExbB proton channel family protein [Verrucomicrobiota bacterium]
MNMILFMPWLFPVANVVSAFRLSNASGRGIVVILLIGSIFAWSIMVTKFAQLKAARAESERFLSAYKNAGHPLALFLKRQKYPASPLYALYQATCRNVGQFLKLPAASTAELFLEKEGEGKRILKERDMRSMRNLTDQLLSEQALDLEKHMVILATAATVAPFLGLLGTVWGVMDAFGGFALSSYATLSAVAPGVSGALLTTVVGLVVALPSLIGYNILIGRIRRLTLMMEHFVQELMADIERHFLQE